MWPLDYPRILQSKVSRSIPQLFGVAVTLRDTKVQGLGIGGLGFM